jgi:hypothetical protein
LLALFIRTKCFVPYYLTGDEMLLDLNSNPPREMLEVTPIQHDPVEQEPIQQEATHEEEAGK